MTPIIENGILATPMDCRGMFIRNVGSIEPVPPPNVDIDDPALSDPREMLPASVTDDSVAAIAAIDQSKINWTAAPLAWLGDQSNQAARGDLSEFVANKGVPDGYASLDANGLIPSAQVPHGPETGSVTSVFLGLPTRTFVVGHPNPITTSGVFPVTWQPAPPGSYFGVDGPIYPGGPIRPRFSTDPLDPGLIPNLDASIFIGTLKFALAVLPPAQWGTVHNPGIIPDPGQHGHPASYLARNMTWRDFPVNLPYQPLADSPQITVRFEPNDDGSYAVLIRSNLANSVLFYRVNDDPFAEAIQAEGATDIVKLLNVQYGDHVWAYAAKQGYSDSVVSEYAVTPPPGDQ